MRCLLPRLHGGLLVALLASLAVAHARVGDSRSTLEKRLSSSGGVVVTDEALANQLLNSSGLAPFLAWEDEPALRPVVYFKSDEGERVFASRVNEELLDDRNRLRKQHEGWVVFVLYHKNRSVLEQYQQTGGLTEAERNGLLALCQGGSQWKQGELPEEAYPAEDYRPLLPRNLHRADHQLLASTKGNALLIYDLDFEHALHQAKIKREQNSAPESLSGF